VPRPEVEAYRDSFVNCVRFNHRDIPSAFIYVGFYLVALGLAWVGNELANHFLAIPKIHPCGTIGCHRVTTGTLPPYHGTGATIPPVHALPASHRDSEVGEGDGARDPSLLNQIPTAGDVPSDGRTP
jgi:hypothetical protein